MSRAHGRCGGVGVPEFTLVTAGKQWRWRSTTDEGGQRARENGGLFDPCRPSRVDRRRSEDERHTAHGTRRDGRDDNSSGCRLTARCCWWCYLRRSPAPGHERGRVPLQRSPSGGPGSEEKSKRWWAAPAAPAWADFRIGGEDTRGFHSVVRTKALF